MPDRRQPSHARHGDERTGTGKADPQEPHPVARGREHPPGGSTPEAMTIIDPAASPSGTRRSRSEPEIP